MRNRAALALFLLTAVAAAEPVDLTALVDASTPQAREAAMQQLIDAGVTLAAATDAAHRFRPDAARRPGSFVYRPANAPADRPAPAILYLHSSGGRGRECLGIWKAHADAIGAVIIAPDARAHAGGYGFSAAERQDAMASLRAARRSVSIDTNRIHMTGVSRGGHMTWDLGTRFPDRWASLAPMTGGPRWLPQRGQNNIRFVANIAHLSIRDLQGERDHPDLLRNLRYAFFKLKKLGAVDAKLLTFPELGHSFRMESVDWPAFLRSAKRDPCPKRVVRTCAALTHGEGRAAWIEIVQLDARVKDAFTPQVDGRKWPTLDATGQRAYMDALVEKKTAWVDARMTGKGTFVIKSRNVRKFELLLTPAMFEAGKPVVVTWNGRKRKKTVNTDVRVLLREFAERFDPSFLPVARVRIP